MREAGVDINAHLKRDDGETGMMEIGEVYKF